MKLFKNQLTLFVRMRERNGTRGMTHLVRPMNAWLIAAWHWNWSTTWRWGLDFYWTEDRKGFHLNKQKNLRPVPMTKWEDAHWNEETEFLLED